MHRKQERRQQLGVWVERKTWLSVSFLPRHHDLIIINSGSAACFIVDSSKSAVTASCHRCEVRHTADEEIGNPLTFFLWFACKQSAKETFFMVAGQVLLSGQRPLQLRQGSLLTTLTAGKHALTRRGEISTGEKKNQKPKTKQP